MSNFLAIATATATLRQILLDSVKSDVSGADVTTLQPGGWKSGSSATGVNIYLYQVTPNAAWRNLDLPTRSPSGQLVQQPRIALDLHYLLSFYGDESTLEPQRLLGSVIRTLHARPVLTRQQIYDTLTNQAFNFLAGSNLADELELIKITLVSLALEELSKLWSIFFQTTYTLSLAYKASVFAIESDNEKPQSALPVRERSIYTVPFRQPVIERVTSPGGLDQPIFAGNIVSIHGKRLLGNVTKVRLGGIELKQQDGSDTCISLQLPTGLRAGVQGMQVVHEMLLGNPPAPHNCVESNVFAFVLRPILKTASFSEENIIVEVDPEIGRDQRVKLLLNELSTPAPAMYTFVNPPCTKNSETIVFPVSGVKTGEYLVRIQVDGAESPLDVNINGQYIGPKVTIS